MQALSPLHCISLDACHKQVENLTERLVDLKQRFGLSSTQRLVQSAHLEMEKVGGGGGGGGGGRVWRGGTFVTLIIVSPAAGQCCVHIRALPPVIGHNAAVPDPGQDQESQRTSPEGKKMAR